MTFKLRREQLAALSRHSNCRFIARMTRHLRERFPEQTRPLRGGRLVQLIRDGIETARGYGVVDETDIRRYLEYMASYGAGFDRDPKYDWAAAVLRNRQLTGKQKMDRIDALDTFAGRGSP